MTTQNRIIPFEATHPGVLIKDELDVRSDLNQKELAKYMGVKPSFLNEIIKGKRPITADLAILLERILEIPADYWLRFQSQYEIDKARTKSKNIARLENIETWNIIRNYVPVAFFKKLGYIKGSLDVDISTIKTIYNVRSTDDLVSKYANSPFAFYRKSKRLQFDEKNLFAWSSLTQYEARIQQVNAFNIERIELLLEELNAIFYENTDTIARVKEAMSRYGIKFVLIQKLEKTPVDGFSFWSESNPAIAMTLRYKRLDNFAFTLMHEIAHVLMHLNDHTDRLFLDLTASEKIDPFEAEADAFAQKRLISELCWNEVNTHTLPLDADILNEIGKKYKTNPSIILGRICFERKDYAVKTMMDRSIH